MSSGRDEWMSNWSQEDKDRELKKFSKTPLERMEDYLKTLEAEMERIKYNIEQIKGENNV